MDVMADHHDLWKTAMDMRDYYPALIFCSRQAGSFQGNVYVLIPAMAVFFHSPYE